MPHIILKKEYKRKLSNFEKVFPAGTKMFVSWDLFHKLIKEGYCDETKKKKELKKETKKTTIKE